MDKHVQLEHVMKNPINGIFTQVFFRETLPEWQVLVLNYTISYILTPINWCIVTIVYYLMDPRVWLLALAVSAMYMAW